MRLFFLLAILFVTGCATSPSMPQQTETLEKTIPYQIPSSKPTTPEKEIQTPNVKNNVVDHIMSNAAKLASNGKYEYAAIELENAIRIAPKRADLYLQLAEIRNQQNRCPEAKSLANKAKQIGLFTANLLLRANNIIAHCLNIKG